MVDGSGIGISNNGMDFNPTTTTTASSSAAAASSANSTTTTTIIENVAELQFGPDFEDIHSTFVLLLCVVVVVVAVSLTVVFC